MDDHNSGLFEMGDASALTGKTIDGIQTLEFLGEGATAGVYRARMPDVNEDIALKVLRPSAAKDPHIVSRFMNEAQALSQLQHENILSSYRYGSAENYHYIAMGLVRGKELFDVLEEREQLPATLAIEIAAGVADGLAYGHERGILHRDIKPENVMVELDGDRLNAVKIVDFGLVKDQNSSAALTVVGMVMGTPQYMSPEVAKGLKANAGSDVYSLGIVLYEMIEGLPPFDDGSTFTIMEMHMKEPLPINTPNFEGLPREVIDIVERMCAKSPEDRVSAADAARELRAILAKAKS